MYNQIPILATLITWQIINGGYNGSLIKSSTYTENNIYVLDSNNKFFEYNMITNMWANLPPVPFLYTDGTSIIAKNNLIYFMFPYSSNSQYIDIFDTIELKWTQLQIQYNSDVPGLYPALVTINDIIYVIGGSKQDVPYYIYGIGSFNTTTNMLGYPLSTPIYRSKCTASIYNNSIYIFGGFTQVKDINTNRYTPMIVERVDTFYIKTSLFSTFTITPYPAFNQGSINIDDKIYLIGGKDGNNNVLNRVDIYYPDINKWQRGPSSNYPSEQPALGYYNNTLFLISNKAVEILKI